jgi:hypothetical protein
MYVVAAAAVFVLLVVMLLLCCLNHQVLLLLQEVGEQSTGTTADVSSSLFSQEFPGLKKTGQELFNRLFQQASFAHPPSKSFDLLELEIHRSQTPSADQLITPALRFVSF